MEEAEAGLVAADVLAVWWWWWWLEERWLVLACWLVKRAAVCQSAEVLHRCQCKGDWS